MSTAERFHGAASVSERSHAAPSRRARLAAMASATILAVARGLKALIAEHSLALDAATKAALPRRQRAHLRALYMAPHSKRRSAAVNDASVVRASESATARRFDIGFEIAVLVIVVGLVAIVAP